MSAVIAAQSATLCGGVGLARGKKNASGNPECVGAAALSSGVPRLHLAGERRTVRAVKVFASSSYDVAGSGEGSTVPRICTLKEFCDSSQPGGGLALAKTLDQQPDSSLAKLVIANVEASAQVADFETLSGRLAMVGFAAALASEFITGNSVFSGIDPEALAKVLLLCLAATGTAAGFALGWRSKKHVSDILASGCKRLVDSAVDSLIEGLLFEEPEAASLKRRD